MADDAVSIDAPEGVRWHAAESGASRGGCARCGSPMFFRSARWPGELHIARALFVDPIDREPQMHGYYDSHVAWVTLGDALPRKDAPADA